MAAPLPLTLERYQKLRKLTTERSHVPSGLVRSLLEAYDHAAPEFGARCAELEAAASGGASSSADRT